MFDEAACYEYASKVLPWMRDEITARRFHLGYMDNRFLDQGISAAEVLSPRRR